MLTNILKVSYLPILPSIYTTVRGLVVNKLLGNKEANISNDLPSLATLEEAILFLIYLRLLYYRRLSYIEYSAY